MSTPETAATATVHRHLGFSWIWLLPLSALVLVAYLFYDLAAQRGPSITITFQSADGLVAQQTLVRYKAVTLGIVEEIELSDDLTQVVARVQMSEEAEELLNDKTNF